MKQINKLIAPGIYSKIATNTRIISIVTACLPTQFACHIECSGSDGQSLNLSVDNAALASQLRFYSDEILTALSIEGLSEYKKIKISARTPEPITKRPSRSIDSQAPALSKQTCTLIESTARSIEHDGLRSALEKLAKIGKNNL